MTSHSNYKENCVDSQRGTFLSNNSYSVSYNYASAGGNYQQASCSVVYEANRADVCSRYTSSSLLLQQQQQQQIDAANKQQDTDAAKMSSIARCINGNTFSNSSIAQQEATPQYNTANSYNNSNGNNNTQQLNATAVANEMNPLLLAVAGVGMCDRTGAFFVNTTTYTIAVNNSSSSNSSSNFNNQTVSKLVTVSSSSTARQQRYILIDGSFNCSLLPDSVNSCAGKQQQ